jgi:AraC family transcriptional activator of mtrCDE
MDWLSRLLNIMPVAGTLDIRCYYGAPWRITYDPSEPGIIPYHVVVSGSALLETSPGDTPQVLTAGDILILPSGAAHTLHDGTGELAHPANYRPGLNHTISENQGNGERLDLLCGHFAIPKPHDRLIRDYLPAHLIIKGNSDQQNTTPSITGVQLIGLVELMRAESASESIGGGAMLNALSVALFTLTLRLASESEDAHPGLLALVGYPRLAPALAAMFEKPDHSWTLPELANLCNMSRATIARHFQEKLGRSPSDLLLDIRMAFAANELKKPGASTASVAASVGYQSEAAFQRIFKARMGITPSQYRRTSTSKNL